MNIDKANINELKSFIGSALTQIAAISNHFGLVRADGELHTYVRDVAALVELSRLSQVALVKSMLRALRGYEAILENPALTPKCAILSGDWPINCANGGNGRLFSGRCKTQAIRTARNRFAPRKPFPLDNGNSVRRR